MENFVLHNPTKLIFGKGVVSQLGEQVKSVGKNVLLLYGKGSIKQNGIYEEIKNQLKNINANIVEYGGIKPNPIVQDADNAIALGIAEKTDVIVAVGGGSVIDTAKFVSLAIPGKFKAWDVVKFAVNPVKAVPIIAVLTLAATGTEMNGNAVLQNHETDEKLGWHHDLAYPKVSFLDPSYTATVSREQTVNGIVDLITHSLEAYFGKGESTISDRLVEAIIKDAIEWAPILLNNLSDYEARAHKMLDATLALNDITFVGKQGGDWGIHSLGHVISLLFDTAHGSTLSVMGLAWMRHISNRNPERIAKLGNQLFGTKTATETIEKLEEFYKKINAPVRMKDLAVDSHNKQRILEVMESNQASGYHFRLTKEDQEKIVDFAF